MLKQLGPHKKVEIPLEVYDEQNNIITEINYVLDKWKSDYETLYQLPIATDDFDEVFYQQCLNELDIMERSENNEYELIPGLNEQISEDEVRKVIRNSKNRKAVGLDNLPNEIFKNDASVKILSTLFLKLFELGLIPSVWRNAVLKPIPKGANTDLRSPLEYRGISLLSTAYKLFSSLLNKRLITCGEVHGLYSDEQNGFRPNRSCDDHCFVLSTIVRQRMACNLSTFVGFVDLRKAFDCVDRKLLLYKLLKVGIGNQLYENIKNIYSICNTSVNVNGYMTEFFSSNFGVRQGDCLSTTLFILYINDIVQELRQNTIGIKNDYFDVQCLLYADDLALVSESEDDLQTMFNILSIWCKKWRMKVNTSKTAIIHFRKPRIRETQFNFTFNSDIITKVAKYKYLGLVFNENLNFKLTSEVLAEAGGRALGAIYTKYKSNKGFGYDTYTKLFNSGVATVLDYGSCIWGFGTYDKINTVHNRAIRLFLGVHRFTSNLGINGEMGWLPSKIRRYMNIIRYWNRLINMDNFRLTKKVFLWDRNSRIKTWCSDVMGVLDGISMSDSFEQNVEIDVQLVKDRWFNVCKDDWSNQVNFCHKLRTYIIFKNDFCTEYYVKNISNRGHRSVLAQFRLGVLPLAIETGRFQNLPLEERLCKFCRYNVLEDEAHFLLICPAFSNVRSVLLDKVISIEPGYLFLDKENKLKLLMSPEIVKHTAAFIFDAMQNRRNILYN